MTLIDDLEAERVIVRHNALTYRARSLGVRCDDFAAHASRNAQRSARHVWTNAERLERARLKARGRACDNCGLLWTELDGRVCRLCGRMGVCT